MWGVCYAYDPREQMRRAWGYLVQESYVPNAWERDTPESASFPSWKPVWKFNADLKSIPVPIVLIQPQDGTKIQGENNLYEFTHPEECCYFFGSDRSDLRPPDLEGLKYQSVYIPDGGFMHSFTAAAMVIYDRKMKQWQS